MPNLDILDFNLIKERNLNLVKIGYFRDNFDVHGDKYSNVDSLVNGDIKGTACWIDIDYTNKAPTNWILYAHNTRIYEICYCDQDKLNQNSEYRDKVLSAFRYWLRHKFYNPNWWYNEIGIPIIIGKISILLWNYMTDEDKTDALDIISKGVVSTDKQHRLTGANQLWCMTVSMYYALLTNDLDLLELCGKLASEEIYYGYEGIQTDGSFFQHGLREYSGGYGINFSFECTQFFYLFAGTNLDFGIEKWNVFLKHLLDGQRMMMQRGYFDYNCTGREFTRPDNLKKYEMLSILTLLKQIDNVPRKDEIEEFYRECLCLKGNNTIKKSLRRTVFYDKATMLCHKDKDRYIGIRCTDKNNLGAEICNGEGELCYNMSYGLNTCFMSKGNEYENIFPVFDYSMVPGTTTYAEFDEEIHNHKDWWNRPCDKNKVYGKTYKNYGVIFEHCEVDDICLDVTFFTFDGCMAALGTNIKIDPTKPAHTTVNQTLEDNYNTENNIISNGDFKYLNLDPSTKLVGYVEELEGTWTRNNKEACKEKITKTLFKLFIPYSPNHPQYAYAVVGRKQNIKIKVIENSEKKSAIVINNSVLIENDFEKEEINFITLF